MKTNWDLSVFYKSFDDPAFAADLAALPGRIDALTAMIDAPADDETAKLRGIVEAFEALNEASEPLYMMVMLTLSTDAQNPAANAAQTPLNRAGMAFAQMESRLSRHLASLDNLDALIEGDEVLRARGFALREYAETAHARRRELPPSPMPVIRYETLVHYAPHAESALTLLHAIDEALRGDGAAENGAKKIEKNS